MKLNVVKIGGQVIDDAEMLSDCLTAFAKLEGPKILVHGGGKEATQMAKILGIPVKMIDGRRVTDTQTLELITMLYGGKINKKIVAKLQALHCNAFGLSGADANVIRAQKREANPLDFGWVGDIVSVNALQIKNLLDPHQLVPIFCAITHDGKGQLLNTNADSIAAQLAIALTEFYTVDLWYCFEQKGVFLDSQQPDIVIETLDYATYQSLKADKIVSEGMLPKLDNCFAALRQKVHTVHIGNIDMLKGMSSHTTIQLNA